MQENKGNSRNEKKGVSPLLAGVSVLVICIFLSVLVAMFSYFNVGGLGYDVINFLRKNEAIALKEKIAIEEEKKELEKLSAKLDLKEKDISEREEDFQKEKDAIKNKEVLLESEIKKYEQLRLSLLPEFQNIQTLVELYSAMDAKKVAELFEKQDDMELKVKILKSMDISFASAVLSNMSPEKAAALLKRVAE